MSHRRPLIGGNWKMNGDLAGSVELTEDLIAALASDDLLEHVDVTISPPFPYLQAVGHALRHYAVDLGGQDCSAHQSGAFTGQTSPSMLSDLGVASVLVGHSERRHGLEESDDLIASKIRAAVDASLIPVLCVGEIGSERDAGKAHDVIATQVEAGLKKLAPEDVGLVSIAYEPVWAIGTGVTATPDDAQSAHYMVRELLSSLYDAELAESIRIIYGGSVKGANAAELFACPDVDGALVGGASLNPEDFALICQAARNAAVHS